MDDVAFLSHGHDNMANKVTAIGASKLGLHICKEQIKTMGVIQPNTAGMKLQEEVLVQVDQFT